MQLQADGIWEDSVTFPAEETGLGLALGVTLEVQVERVLSRECLPTDAALEELDAAVGACVGQQRVAPCEALAAVLTFVHLGAIAVHLHVEFQVVAAGELLPADVAGIHAVMPQEVVLLGKAAVAVFALVVFSMLLLPVSGELVG